MGVVEDEMDLEVSKAGAEDFDHIRCVLICLLVCFTVPVISLLIPADSRKRLYLTRAQHLIGLTDWRVIHMKSIALFAPSAPFGLHGILMLTISPADLL